MSQVLHRLGQGWTTSLLGIGLWTGFGAVAPPAAAQVTPAAARVTPDTSPSSLGTLVNGLQTSCLATAVCDITGGTAAGSNLFHSFSEFSINGGSATFRDLPQGTEVIFSRVKGAQSFINGELSIEPGSTADLFLMNPKGIVFGPNARLNLGGSFTATTATGLGFGENGAFDMATTSAELGLLTVTPSAFLYSQIPQPIHVQPGAELTVSEALPGAVDPNGLLLAGGDVTIEGGQLRAPGGVVLLTGLSTLGELAPDGTASAGAELADVALSNQSIVNLVANDGGSLLISAKDISISGSTICGGVGANAGGANPSCNDSNNPADQTVFLGSASSEAGNIALNATEAVEIQNSRIENNVNGGATANQNPFDFDNPYGSISVTASSLTVDNSFIDVGTYGNGNAGAIVFAVEGATNITGGSSLSSSVRNGGIPGAEGNAGGILGVSGSIRLSNGSFIDTSTSGNGDAGAVLLVTTTQDILLEDGSGITSLSFEPSGSPGLDIPGDAGLVFLISAEDLQLEEGSFVTTTTTTSGSAGVVIAFANDEISLDDGSLIFSSVLPLDDRPVTGSFGGVLTVSNRLVLRDGSFIDVSNFGTGTARELGSEFGNDRANAVAAGLSEQVQQGGILFALSNQVILDDSSALSAVSESGQGGNILLFGGDFVALSESSAISTDGQIFQRTFAGGRFPGGFAEARQARQGQGGGNITIDTPILVATPRRDNDITATAFNQTGGNVDLTDTDQLFNIAERPRRTTTNDLNADSEFGPSGTVSTNTLDVDPSRSLDDLPDNRLPDLLAEGCRPNGRPVPKDKLYITRLGGMPPNPNDLLRGNLQLAELEGGPVAETATATPEPAPSTETDPPATSPPIVAAQGWVRDESGAVFFSARPSEPVFTARQPSYSSCGGKS